MVATTVAGIAQDVSVLAPAWIDDQNAAGDQPPVFKQRRPHMEYPRELRKAGDVGYVLVVQSVGTNGRRALIGRGGSHPYFLRAVFDSMRELDVEPAMGDGKPVDSFSWLAVIFNPATAAKKGPDAAPRLVSVAPVIVPREELKIPSPGELPVVWGTVVLDAAGHPQSVTLDGDAAEKVRAPIEASLPRWAFAPARRAGTAVAGELRVPFVLQPPMQPDAVARMTPPRRLKTVEPVYPRLLAQNRLRGEVTVQFEVGADGRVHNAVIERSNHPAFNEPALEAVRQWTFEPARRGGKAVAAKMSMMVVFQIRGAPGGGAESLQLTGGRDPSKLPPQFRYDTPPKPRSAGVPVYPYELLRAGTKGSATVLVLVGPDGKIAAVNIAEASAPEFGLALAAMAELLQFDPALKDGQPTQALVRVERNFNTSAREGLVASEDLALLRLEKKSPEKIVSGSALDGRLQPISRRAPAFPLALLATHATGEAVIECLIDDDGRARLPRVVHATAPEFGYAAAQAVATWEFQPPKANGKPAVARARIPFKFSQGEPN